jgi:hypothetical protein
VRVIPPAPKNQKLTTSELTRTFAAVLLHRRGSRWRLRGLGVGKKPDPVSEANLWQNKILRAFAVVFVLLVLIGGSVLWFGYRQHRAKLVPPYLVLLDPRQNPFLFLGGKISRSSLITNARRHDLGMNGFLRTRGRMSRAEL